MVIRRVFPLVFLVVAAAALACSTAAPRNAASPTAADIPRAVNSGGGSSGSPATPVTAVAADRQSRAELLGLDASEIQTLLGRDAIRSIDDPEFVTIDIASQWMSDDEQVIGG